MCNVDTSPTPKARGETHALAVQKVGKSTQRLTFAENVRSQPDSDQRQRTQSESCFGETWHLLTLRQWTGKAERGCRQPQQCNDLRAREWMWVGWRGFHDSKMARRFLCLAAFLGIRNSECLSFCPEIAHPIAISRPAIILITRRSSSLMLVPITFIYPTHHPHHTQLRLNYISHGCSIVPTACSGTQWRQQVMAIDLAPLCSSQ